jgi:predicted metal-dependent phosphoesterase TrpH
MKIDLHCHTRYSNDNFLEPRDLISSARSRGLDGVVVTEHHSFDASRPVEMVARNEGFLVLRGVEVSTDRGHLLLYGVSDDSWNAWGRNNYLRAADVIQAAARSGALVVAAHPYATRDLYALGDGIYDLAGLEAVEVANGRNGPQEDELADTAAERLGLPRVGGSDCHSRREVGRCHTVFENPVTTLVELIREIRAGRCRPARL